MTDLIQRLLDAIEGARGARSNPDNRCWCCREWRPSRILWYRGDNPFALRTWCIACKHGACERCSE